MHEHKNGNKDNHFPAVDVAIPQTVVIDCPIVRPMMRAAVNCKKCKHFKGVLQSAWSDEAEIAWSDKYGILCGFIAQRKTRQVVVE